MFVNGSGQNAQFLERTAHRCFLPSFGSFGQAVSEEKIKKIGQSETRIVMFLDRDKISNLYRGSTMLQFIWLRGFRGED